MAIKETILHVKHAWTAQTKTGRFTFLSFSENNMPKFRENQAFDYVKLTQLLTSAQLPEDHEKEMNWYDIFQNELNLIMV